jgi:hypothetical protein
MEETNIHFLVLLSSLLKMAFACSAIFAVLVIRNALVARRKARKQDEPTIPPFQHTDETEWIRRLANGEPLPHRQLKPKTPAESSAPPPGA